MMVPVRTIAFCALLAAAASVALRRGGMQQVLEDALSASTSGTAISLNVSDVAHRFQAWQIEFNVNIHPSEMAARVLLWAQTDAAISEHNGASPTRTFAMGHNAFSAFSESEWLALVSHPISAAALQSDWHGAETTGGAPAAQLSPTVDWQALGAVHAPADLADAHCHGGAYASTAAGVLEGAHFIVTGQLRAVSVQQLVDCVPTAGCFGGTPWAALEWVRNKGGVCSARHYAAWAGKQEPCRACNDASAVYQVARVNRLERNNGDALKGAIAKQPVGVLLHAGRHLKQYASGIIPGTGCDAEPLGLSGLVVGYTAGQSLTVRMPWGSRWGDKGYVKLDADGAANGGAGTCGVASYALTADFPPTPSQTPSATPTRSPPVTPTSSISRSETLTASPSSPVTPTSSISRSGTLTASPSSPATPTSSTSQSETARPTRSPNATQTSSASYSETMTASPSSPVTPTSSASYSETATPHATMKAKA